MYIDRFLYPVTSLGPGKRLVIWVSGCERRCEGCANPELWKQSPKQKIEVQKLAQMILSQPEIDSVDGITVSGGEPFNQAAELRELLEIIKQGREVLIFTGYTIGEIRENQSMKNLLEMTDVLIDGEYIDSLNDGKAVLRGSTNQRIHILNEACWEKYREYLNLGRQIQNFTYDYKTISVGIHMNSKL